MSHKWFYYSCDGKFFIKNIILCLSNGGQANGMRDEQAKENDKMRDMNAGMGAIERTWVSVRAHASHRKAKYEFDIS